MWLCLLLSALGFVYSAWSLSLMIASVRTVDYKVFEIKDYQNEASISWLYLLLIERYLLARLFISNSHDFSQRAKKHF